jgi:putative Mg2+ transporter-C (MgtC) family protein
MDTMEIITRAGVSVALAGLVGLDRELKSHPAGLRTHMLTALAASAFTMLALEIFEEAKLRSSDQGLPDPIRAIEAATAGVAFLATGGIIRSRGQVSGLTTGAAMWLAGAVGVACGAGAFRIAFIATAFAVAILTLVTFLERILVRQSTKLENRQAEAEEDQGDRDDGDARPLG